jgi:hypothetical protein
MLLYDRCSFYNILAQGLTQKLTHFFESCLVFVLLLKLVTAVFLDFVNFQDFCRS